MNNNIIKGVFLITPTFVLKEQFNFLSQLIKKSIIIPPNEVTYSFFAELYIHILTKQQYSDLEIIKKFVHKLLTINSFDNDTFLIKQFTALFNIQQFHMVTVIETYIKRYERIKSKEEILNELKSELQKHIIVE